MSAFRTNTPPQNFAVAVSIISVKTKFIQGGGLI